MARARKAVERRSVAGQVLETPESSLLDLLDHLLNKGVMATGDITIGVAGIDLIYLRLSSILCAADRVLPRERLVRRRRAPRRLRSFPKRSA
jgi:hypothetical protein